MKWFKHFTNAHNDNALTKVRMRYGADGYAVYWYCLELIAGDLDGSKANFELSHDAEVIGYALKIDQLRVEEIMQYMVKLNLFEQNNSIISCLKIAKFLDKKSTRNPEIHAIIDNVAHINNKLSATSTDVSATSAARLDKIRLDKKKTTSRFTPPTVQEVKEYCVERKNRVDPQEFVDHYETNGWMRGKTKIKDWKACVRTWEKNKMYKKEEQYDAFGGF